MEKKRNLRSESLNKMETKPSSLVYENIAPTTSCKSLIKLELEPRVEHPVDSHISYLLKDEECISPHNPLCGSEADNDTTEVCVIKPEDIVEIPESELAEIYNGNENGTCNQGSLAITKIECESSIIPKVNSNTDDVTYEALVEDGCDTKICQFLESDEIDIKFDSQNCMDFFEEEEHRDDATFSNLSSDFIRELKIILKDILVDQNSGAKIVLKYVTVPLIKIDVETITKRTSLKSRNTKNNSASCNQPRQRKPRSKVRNYCPYCNRDFSRRDSLMIHMGRIHSDKNSDLDLLKKNSKGKYFACEICNYSPLCSGNYMQHMLTHGRFNNSKVYKCDHCDYQTVFGANFRSHIRVHLKDKPSYTCRFCNKTLFSKVALGDHLLSFHNDKLDKSLTTLFSRNIKHCKFCRSGSFRTINITRLKRHMATHGDRSNITTFKCYNCNFECVHKISLVKHMAIHLEKIFKCKICEASFGAQAALDTHLRNSHRSKYLQKQVEAELGDRLLSCLHCEYKTICKHNIIRHLRIKHQKGTENNR